MRRISGLCFERLDHDRFDPVIADLARRAATWLVAQAIKAMPGETLAPDPHRLPRDADRIRDLAIIHPVAGTQHDLGALRFAA